MNSAQHPRYALYKPPVELFAENRRRLAARLADPKAAAIVQGASEVPLHDTDVNMTSVMRQDKWFTYLCHYDEADCLIAVIGGTPEQKGKSILFVPRLDPSYAIWLGALPSLDKIKEQTGVDEVHYSESIAEVLRANGIETVHVLAGLNSDSKLPARTARFEGMADFKVEGADSSNTPGQSKLFNIMSNLRSIKSKHEVELLARANEASSRAHVHVMQSVKPAWSQNQIESTFCHYCFFHFGCRFVSYSCICATGEQNATLHYPNNDLRCADGQMALLDMGAELCGYASDITCSFPVNGKFSDKQKAIYNAVLDGVYAVYRAMKPGVLWTDMHKLSARTVSTHLRRMGIITCDEDTAEAADLMYVFQPHGLGHQMGLAVHDVGNYDTEDPNQKARPTEKLTSRLRNARVLEAGLCLTVEPGCYFNATLLEAAFKDEKLKPLLNEKLIREEFWDFGGVRIEDDVIVTETGVRNLTKVPRTVEEIEAVMAGKEWKIREDFEEFVNVKQE